MAEQINLESKSRSTTFAKVILLFLLVAGFITTFFTGYYIAKWQTVPGQPQPTKTPTPTLVSHQPGATGVPQQSTEFLPGKYYFDDTLIAITKTKPTRTLAVSVRRLEQENEYLHNTGASFFNGTSWKRDTDSRKAPNATIVSNPIVQTWNVAVDPSRVLKQRVTGKITVSDTPISFDTGMLFNEIGMRSLPGYTKFMSTGNGTMLINGESVNAYMLYTRIYSLNASDIQFYNQPIGLTTDWLAFWDTQGNFYHIDATAVKTPTPIYESHQIAVMNDTKGTVVKTFGLSVTRDTVDDPITYSMQLESPITTTIRFTRTDKLNKAPNASYTWFSGNVTGEVRKSDGSVIPGIGLMEYIHN